jgi:hypothetical protein
VALTAQRQQIRVMANYRSSREFLVTCYFTGNSVNATHSNNRFALLIAPNRLYSPGHR